MSHVLPVPLPSGFRAGVRLFGPLLTMLDAIVESQSALPDTGARHHPDVLLTVTSRLDRAAQFEAAADAAGWQMQDVAVTDPATHTPSFEHTRLVRLSRRRRL
jgi:hypothetical protein